DDANGAVPHQVLEPGLLGHFAARGVGGGLAGFEVALGEPPVAIGVADQEEPRLAARSAPEYDPARRGPARGPPRASWPRLDKAEREILPRVRLDVRQELPPLDHREGGLAIEGRV